MRPGVKRVCFHCADRLPLSQFDEKNEEPEDGDACDHCGHVYKRTTGNSGVWGPPKADEALRRIVDGRPDTL